MYKTLQKLQFQPLSVIVMTNFHGILRKSCVSKTAKKCKIRVGRQFRLRNASATQSLLGSTKNRSAGKIAVKLKTLMDLQLQLISAIATSYMFGLSQKMRVGLIVRNSKILMGIHINRKAAIVPLDSNGACETILRTLRVCSQWAV